MVHDGGIGIHDPGLEPLPRGDRAARAVWFRCAIASDLGETDRAALDHWVRRVLEVAGRLAA